MNEETARRLAIGMAVLCVRNTCIEDIHAGIEPSRPLNDAGKLLSSGLCCFAQLDCNPHSTADFPLIEPVAQV